MTSKANLDQIKIGDAIIVPQIAQPQKVTDVSHGDVLGFPWVELKLEPPEVVERAVYPTAFSGHARSEVVLFVKGVE